VPLLAPFIKMIVAAVFDRIREDCARRFLLRRLTQTPLHLDSARRLASLHLTRFLPFLDQLPKLAGFAKLRVFGNRKFAAEQEIAERVLV
jgi:hypothetical protein